jgi:hypothetical protein
VLVAIQKPLFFLSSSYRSECCYHRRFGFRSPDTICNQPLIRLELLDGSEGFWTGRTVGWSWVVA